MSSDPGERFVAQGLESYVPTIRAVDAFEEALGGEIAAIIDEVCGASVFEAEPARWKAQRKATRPWVLGWAKLRHGDSEINIWAGVHWNLADDPRKASLTVSLYPRDAGLEERIAKKIGALASKVRVGPADVFAKDVDPARGVAAGLRELLESFVPVLAEELGNSSTPSQPRE